MCRPGYAGGERIDATDKSSAATRWRLLASVARIPPAKISTPYTFRSILLRYITVGSI